jgi:hypothetical protein
VWGRGPSWPTFASLRSGAADKLFVVTGHAGRVLAVSQINDGFVLDDLTEDRRLGDLNGDLMPFVLAIEERPFIVVAGVVLGLGADRVEVKSAGFTGIGQTCRVRNQVWLSFPEPFTEGMVITATWRKGDRVLFECVSEPLRADALHPIFGPGWTSYAPG